MEENKEITFGKIIKVAFSNWKVFTPVAVVVAIGVGLGIQFGYNNIKGNYTSTFSYSSMDLSQDKYADGSDFFYKNLISYGNLSAIKNSNELYASVDVDTIVEKNAISITTPEEGEKTYTIKLSYRYVKDAKIAKSFIKDIAESALKRDASIVNDGSYNASLQLFDKAKTFEDKVMYLNAQAQYLTRQYKRLTNTSEEEETTTEKEDKTKKTTTNTNNLPSSVIELITANNQQLDNIMPSYYVSSMNARISTLGLSLDYSDEAIDKLVDKSTLLGYEKADNDARITSINNALKEIKEAAAITELSKTVETLTLRNVDIEQEQAKITKINDEFRGVTDPAVEVAGYKDFVDDLQETYDGLVGAIGAYKNVLNAAYINNAAVDYEESSITKLNGTISLPINILISVAVGAVVGAVVNLIVDRKKLYE